MPGRKGGAGGGRHVNSKLKVSSLVNSAQGADTKKKKKNPRNT